MKWKQVSRYHLESDCKQYTVAKMASGDGVKYIAWRRNPPVNRQKQPPTWLGICDTADEAKQLCEGA